MLHTLITPCTFQETYHHLGPDLLAIVLSYADIKQTLTMLASISSNYKNAVYSCKYIVKCMFMRLAEFIHLSPSNVTYIQSVYLDPENSEVLVVPGGTCSTWYSRQTRSYHYLCVLIASGLIDLLIQSNLESDVIGFENFPPTTHTYCQWIRKQMDKLWQGYSPPAVVQPTLVVHCHVINTTHKIMIIPFCILKVEEDVYPMRNCQRVVPVLTPSV
jgi:hypothetical protein